MGRDARGGGRWLAGGRGADILCDPARWVLYFGVFSRPTLRFPTALASAHHAEPRGCLRADGGAVVPSRMGNGGARCTALARHPGLGRRRGSYRHVPGRADAGRTRAAALRFGHGPVGETDLHGHPRRRAVVGWPVVTGVVAFRARRWRRRCSLFRRDLG